MDATELKAIGDTLMRLGAFHRFTETPNRSISLFLRNSGRKIATHFPGIALVTPDMTPKELIKAVRKEHPQASKKDIARAAFHAIIANADQDLGKTRNLQAFAFAERPHQPD